MKRTILLVVISILLFMNINNCKSISSKNMLKELIPYPAKVKIEDGRFTFDNNCQIIVKNNDHELKKNAVYLREKINIFTGFKLSIVPNNPLRNQKNSISLILDEHTELGNEGYRLNINKNGIKIIGSKPAGIFYGVQSLISFLPIPDKGKLNSNNREKVFINAVSIIDKPRYKWRGMMLDTCRHFMPVKFIKKFIDSMAMHKMNRFHWHLTEDQGWRIEIKKYPLLTKIGAWRPETIAGHYRDKPRKFDGKKHGGFYSKEDIRKIVEYAKERYITIIPEIEMPGHSGAAIASYPELSCTGGPFEVKKVWGIYEDVYCAGKESTFEFLENVLLEVIELFPSEYIHIGGDECPKSIWKECVLCQARIKKEGLKDEHELQSYFIKRIEKFLTSKGKKLIGWDEILEGGLPPEATVMSWRGTAGGIKAAEQGHNVIMSPTSHCYFDYYQGQKENEPIAIGGYLPLEKVYSFDPTPKKLSEEKKKHILGGQANLWTEYVKTPKKAEYMLFPRMDAIAEVLWTKKENKNWKNFKIRLKKQLRKYEFLKINYSKSNYNLIKKK